MRKGGIILSRALIIISHGSRSKDAAEAFDQIVDMVRKKDQFQHVAGASLEHSELNISQTIAQVAETRVTEIIFAPYFLYEGIHIKEDIPHLLKEISPNYPNITFKMAKPIGVEPVLADIILDRALAVK